MAEGSEKDPLAEITIDGDAGRAAKRPSGSEGADFIVDPSEVIDAAGPEIVTRSETGTETERPEFERPAAEQPRKRGRPKGSRNGQGTAKGARGAKVDLSGTEMVLLSIHELLAGITQQPAMKLAPKEAEELAKAMANVQQHYPITLDPKIQAWFGLGMVASAVYGPRLYMMRAGARARADTQGAQPRQAQNQPGPKSAPANDKGAPKRQGPLTPSQLFEGRW